MPMEVKELNDEPTGIRKLRSDDGEANLGVPHSEIKAKSEAERSEKQKKNQPKKLKSEK